MEHCQVCIVCEYLKRLKAGHHKMLLTSGLAALLGTALVGAKNMAALKIPSSIVQHPSAVLKNSTHPKSVDAKISNVIPGMYLVEFSDGHVCSPSICRLPSPC